MVITAILGICQFGARIGYQGQGTSITVNLNLATAEADCSIVGAEIESELGKWRLELYTSKDALLQHFTASPLGLVDMADGSKRRIHHLSYPPGDSSSINSCIPESYGTISYSTIQQAIEAIQKSGDNGHLVKRDFESAFRHIPVSPLDIPLLGFHWDKMYYEERFLPFGL